MHGPVVLFPGAFQCTPRKTRTSSSTPGQTFQTCGSAHAFSKSLVIFFLLGVGKNSSESSHPSSVPLWLPDQDGTCSIFPTSSRNVFVHPAALPFPPEPLHSPRPDVSSVTHCSRVLQGSPALFGFTSPGLSAAHTGSWVLVPHGFPLALVAPEAEECPRCCRRALPGRCCSCNRTPHRRRSGRWAGRCPRPAGPRRSRRNKSPLGTFGASWGHPR